MKKFLFLFILFLVFSSHDMFLKLDTYFLQPNTRATINLFNGTFDKSENVITRDRMIDVSMVHNGTRMKVDTSQWFDKDSTTLLNFETREEGTYVVGVSTKARNIEMDAEAFNGYLEHDGVLDMIALRESTGTTNEDAVESYAKHVKAIFQVGNRKSEDWKTVLGYPIEFVPLSNPYNLHTGDKLQVKLLSGGVPLSNQLVYAGSRAAINGHSHHQSGTDEHSHADESKEHSHDDDEESHSHSHEQNGDAHSHAHDDEEHSHGHGNGDGHSHAHDEEHAHGQGDGDGHSHAHDEEEAHSHSHDDGESHTHTSGQQLRTDENGLVTVSFDKDGIYYLRTIHLVLSEEEGLTHESNWATLTFEVGHDHPVVADHDHAHEEEAPFGIPSYAYWLGSLAIVAILFFIFYNRNDASSEKE